MKQILRRTIMSTSNFITNLLQLKEKNITFSDEFSTIKKKDVLYKVINATLSYIPSFCPVCGCINEHHSIIKHGTKSSDIKLLPFNGEPLILRLRKQRFLCHECNQTFSAKTNIVEPKCYISKQVKLHIINNLRLKISEKDIAYMNFVSHSTVSRAIDNSFSEFIPDPNYLPAHLMFDEFKSTKDAKGAMSFIFADADTHQIIDIVENRQLPHLTQYFGKYTKEARDKVESVCIDMYSPYISLIESTFKNAKIIVDRFHIVQLLTRALQKTRIETMKDYSTRSMEYKRLKRYWKLLLKDKDSLNRTVFKHTVHFKNWVSQQTIVDTTLSVNETLKNSYKAYQTILKDVSNKNKLLMQSHLKELLDTDISDPMKTAIKTLLKYFKYISNSLGYEYSNGPIEGLNNYIKVIKRIAFGYKSFVHFRNRILISKNLLLPLKKYQAA